MRLAALLVAFAVLATLASAGLFKPADYTNFFSRFTKTFSRQYSANVVKEKLDIFKVNIDKITLINAKAPGTLHINGLADMPAETFRRMLAFRAPESVYVAVQSIAQGKNRDGGNTALALLQAEEDVNAPVNEEARAAVDAYAASFLDMSSEAELDAYAEVETEAETEVEAGAEVEEEMEAATGLTNDGKTNGTSPVNATGNPNGSAAAPKKPGFFSRLFGSSKTDPAAVAARKAEEARQKEEKAKQKADLAKKKAEVKAEQAKKKAEEKAARQKAADEQKAARDASRAAPSAEKAELLAFADAGFDWRTKGVLGEARHQGTCGSCWAYSTISVIEAGLAIKRKVSPLPVLSEQHLVDCDSGNGGCNGGWYTNAFKFVAQNGARSTAAYGPYQDKKESCRGSSVAPYEHKIKGSKNVFGYSGIRSTGDYHLNMIKAIKEDGPVATAIYAPDFLQFWGKGIMMGSNCTVKKVNHAVVVVGYGLEKETNTRYWIIRNSWGRSWGDSTGHYRMERHETENTCGYHVGAFVPDF